MCLLEKDVFFWVCVFLIVLLYFCNIEECDLVFLILCGGLDMKYVFELVLWVLCDILDMCDVSEFFLLLWLEFILKVFFCF